MTDEIRFLGKLVTHQTLFSSDEADLITLQELTKELAAVQVDIEHVRKDLKEQIHLIYDMTVNKGLKRSAIVGNGQETLENDVADLTKRFRSMKSSVLKHAAKILEHKSSENEL